MLRWAWEPAGLDNVCPPHPHPGEGPLRILGDSIDGTPHPQLQTLILERGDYSWHIPPTTSPPDYPTTSPPQHPAPLPPPSTTPTWWTASSPCGRGWGGRSGAAPPPGRQGAPRTPAAALGATLKPSNCCFLLFFFFPGYSSNFY